MTTSGTPDARVELLGPDAIEPLIGHLLKSAPENGRDGDAYARAREPDDLPSPPVLTAHLRDTWARPVTACGWQRGFGLWVGEQIVGHLDLRGGSIPTELHRASVGMGLQRPHRRAGHGRRMLDHAIAWARDAGLTWLDLAVFTDNAPARALYARCGFVEVGTTVDRFRIEGNRVDDVAMVLRLC